jgi:GntR family transcriptional regulator/MocR family aminotransferase
MSIERRLKLLDWAARSGAWVVEDDYDSEFRYGLGAAPALQGLDAADSVIYVGTFARTLFPGLRLGYIVAPTAMRDALRAAKWLADRGSAPLEQRALAAFMAGGAYESARRRLVRALGEKRRRLHAALGAQFAAGEIEASDAAAGTHVFLRLPRVRARDADALVEAARRRGVGVYSAAAYHLGAPRSATLICGYATVPLEAIDDGVRRFAEAYRAFR